MTTIMCPKTRQEFKQLIASNDKKIVIVKASAKWCKPCRDCHDYVIEQFNNHKHDNGKLLIFLDIDDCRDVSSFLRIKRLPTLLSYKDGQPNQVVYGGGQNDINTFFRKSFS